MRPARYFSIIQLSNSRAPPTGSRLGCLYFSIDYYKKISYNNLTRYCLFYIYSYYIDFLFQKMLLEIPGRCSVTIWGRFVGDLRMLLESFLRSCHAEYTF